MTSLPWDSISTGEGSCCEGEESGRAFSGETRGSLFTIQRGSRGTVGRGGRKGGRRTTQGEGSTDCIGVKAKKSTDEFRDLNCIWGSWDTWLGVGGILGSTGFKSQASTSEKSLKLCIKDNAPGCARQL
uniref:Uncharacterized protein n=1 Tax=Myotis myotis TaxID=51298 RepID=A0A7J7TTU8_MYOMY|nr:hypothetical protein mMyoMyo1_008999 [Myotis myotis]